MSDWVWLGIALLALVVGSIRSTLVQSLRDISRPVLEVIVTTRRRPTVAARIEHILDDLEGHASATALPRTFFNLLVAVALVFWVRAVRDASDTTADSIWIDGVVGIAISCLLLWLFTSVLPSSISRYAGELMVYSWSGLLRAMYVLCGPLRWVADGVELIVKRLAGKADQTEAQVLHDEILSAVEEARDEGQVDDSERDMIEAIVRFREKTVAQVMTPRTEIKALEVTKNLGEVTAAIRKIGHSRIPVYNESMDRIVGVFYVKDLMRWLAGEASRSGKTFDLKALLRPAYFVPETKTVRELLTELLKKRVHIAIVADEYGGTAGLVTIEDIIEEVFGDIQDEYEVPESEVDEVKLNLEKKWADVEGRVYITDANDEMQPLGVQIPESEEYDTVAGFVNMTLGRIPASGETFMHERLKITVLRAEPTRVTRIRVEAVEASPSEEPQLVQNGEG